MSNYVFRASFLEGVMLQALWIWKYVMKAFLSKPMYYGSLNLWGTEKHQENVEFHILCPPPRSKPNNYHAKHKSLGATRMVGKEFLNYFSFEDQAEEDFLKSREKYDEFFISLWFYSPILSLGRLHETYRCISVTRSRTVGSTPWTGDQFVTMSLRVCPGWLWGWRSWWNEWFWQGKPKYSEKTCPDATLSTTNATCQAKAAAVDNNV
jgi:hypothetical protein